MFRSKHLALVLLTGLATAMSTASATAEEPKESIHVTVVGKIQTGIAAIGGETTGVLIRSKNITWELELGRDEKKLKTAAGLDGKLVRVTGTLERRKGVEIGERWIVTVESLAPAGKQPKR